MSGPFPLEFQIKNITVVWPSCRPKYNYVDKLKHQCASLSKLTQGDHGARQYFSEHNYVHSVSKGLNSSPMVTEQTGLLSVTLHYPPTATKADFVFPSIVCTSQFVI